MLPGSITRTTVSAKEHSMTTKRITVTFVAILLGINLALAVKIYSESSSQRTAADDPYTQIELLTKVMELIRSEYVDANNLTYRDMAYGAMRGMLESLDPHSQFMDPVHYQDMREDTEGKFGGLGIVVSMSAEGFLTIVAPMEDTPGARAGLLPGDRIIKIAGQLTEKMSLEDAVEQLRGAPGSKVTITVFRQKAASPADRVKDYTIERAEIKVDSVKDAKILENGIGYVRITQFNEPTSDELDKALEKLKAAGMDALILDIRNNPGGLLDQARKVASKFIPAGELIVSTEGRDPEKKLLYRSESRGPKYLTMPLAVIVNQGSASASEIVAGALQDLGRAMVVGETTFGKGSVQSILPLPDGSAVRLTTAKYYTPSHKVIHEKGITPDMVVPVSEESERKLLEQRSRPKLPPAEGETVPPPVPDEQLERAMDMIKGVKLYKQLSQAASKRAGVGSATK
jgi:carboxyl-terminal processing protease